jgi:hypothetical protein
LLPETIDSILSQDYPNLEYIVLDDGSTDDTREVLGRYGSRILWDSHPNMGETRTVNKGWGMARGELVVTVSSDDPVRPGLISEGVRFMQEHPEVLVAYPDWAIIDEQSRVVREIVTFEYHYLSMVRWHHCFPGPGTFLRRKCFELAGMRDPAFRFVGDYEYWLRLGLHGPFARIPKTLAQWRSHAGAITHVVRDVRMADEHVRMMRMFFARPDLPPEVRTLRREAMSAAYFVAGESCCATDLPAARHYYRRCAVLCALGARPRPNNIPLSRQRLWLISLSPAAYRGAKACRSCLHRATAVCRSASRRGMGFCRAVLRRGKRVLSRWRQPAPACGAPGGAPQE